MTPPPVSQGPPKAGSSAMQLAVRIVAFLGIFSAATFAIWRVLLTIAVELEDDVPFPSTLDEVKLVQRALFEYQQDHFLHVAAVGAAAYTYKQSFALPGSGAMNVLLGAVFGLSLGFPMACALTAVGSSFAYLIAALVLEPIILRIFPVRLAKLKAAVESDTSKGDLLITMIGIRVFPLTPQWFVNMASPIVRVPLVVHFASVFVGVAPYNFVCVQAGTILAELNAFTDILTPQMMLQLALLGCTVLGLSWAKRRLARRGPGRGQKAD